MKRTCMISKSVIDICKNYNISVVAEGVENEKEYDILKEMGCDEAQGYLFDKPMSWNRFEEKIFCNFKKAVHMYRLKYK